MSNAFGMDPYGFGTAVSQISGSLINGYFQKSINDKNIDFQKDANKQNVSLMREAWARDDSAVQRRVNDLINAGLSPTLAAGSAAGNTSPVQVQAPHITKNPIGSAIEFASAVGTVMQQFANVQKTKAETIRTLTNNKYLDDFNAYRNSYWFEHGYSERWKGENYQLKASILSGSYDNQLNKINWETKIREAQYNYLQKQLEIFNNTNIDPTSNLGVANILKLFLGDLNDYAKSHR